MTTPPDRIAANPLDACVESLTGWAYTDSLVQLDRGKLRQCLADDHERAGYLMTDEQCYSFICGGDDGAPPSELVRDFPKTHAFIAEYWR